MIHKSDDSYEPECKNVKKKNFSLVSEFGVDYYEDSNRLNRKNPEKKNS